MFTHTFTPTGNWASWHFFRLWKETWWKLTQVWRPYTGTGFESVTVQLWEAVDCGGCCGFWLSRNTILYVWLPTGSLVCNAHPLARCLSPAEFNTAVRCQLLFFSNASSGHRDTWGVLRDTAVRQITELLVLRLLTCLCGHRSKDSSFWDTFSYAC